MKAYSFKILGRIPSKKNSRQNIVRGGRKFSVPSDEHHAWHESACYQVKQMDRPVEPIKNATIFLLFFAPDKRKADLTNKAESVMDMLVDMDVLVDDNWFVVGDIRLKFGGVDKENPRVIVEITPHENKET